MKNITGLLLVNKVWKIMALGVLHFRKKICMVG